MISYMSDINFTLCTVYVVACFYARDLAAVSAQVARGRQRVKGDEAEIGRS